MSKRKASFHDASLRSEKIPIGSKTVPAIVMRNAATWVSLNRGVPSRANMPRFIRINELPQMEATASKSSQLFMVFDIRKSTIHSGNGDESTANPDRLSAFSAMDVECC